MVRTIPPHTAAIFVQAILGTAVSIAVSVASYHAFEKHWLKLKDVWARREI